jgi:integrase
MTTRLPRNTSTGMAVPHLDEFLATQNRIALTKRGRPLAQSTVRATTTRLRTVLPRLPTGKDLLTVLADRRLTEQLLDRILAEMSQGSARNILANLRAYQDWCLERGYLTATALSGTDIPVYRATRHIDVYSPEDIDRLLMGAMYVSERFQLAMTTLADTGMRVGELLALRWEHVAPQLEPPRYHIAQAKNGEPREAVMTKRVAYLWGEADTGAMKRGAPEVTGVGGRTRKHWSRDTKVYPFAWAYSTFLPMVERLATDSEVEYRGIHALRHTAATRWLREGHGLLDVALTLGHKSTAVTERFYSHLTSLDVAHVVGWDE